MGTHHQHHFRLGQTTNRRATVFKHRARRLTGWAKTVSNEVAADNVTVNNVAPGYTLTERQDELAEARARTLGKTKEEMIELWAAQTPIRRLASPEEIAAAIAFLASERASYITGVTLQVDGGWVKGLL